MTSQLAASGACTARGNVFHVTAASARSNAVHTGKAQGTKAGGQQHTDAQPRRRRTLGDQETRCMQPGIAEGVAAHQRRCPGVNPARRDRRSGGGGAAARPAQPPTPPRAHTRARPAPRAYSSFLTTLVPRRRPVRRAAMRPTFWPGGAQRETVDAWPMCCWLPPPWGWSTGFMATPRTCG